ncbi:MAG: helix-turn-helix domain-containing protein [Alphaproteobacteria bacterium]|nr:helix-turn-helix domain-containing protein [Alphaproteobacteria bacterium]
MTEEIEVTTEPIVEAPVEMTAGEMLRNARTTGRRKREIPTIAKQLCIREEFLEALENGDYNAIPETVYILGFARNYAMELGLEPEEVIAKIKKEMGLLADCAADDDDVTACAMPSIKEEEHWAKILFVKCYQFVYQNWQWFAGALLAIILTIVLIVVLTPNSDSVKVADTNTAVVEEVSTEKYNLPVRERFGTDNRDKADVVLQASQESWVKVEDGRGNTVFSRVLVPGDIYYVPAGDKYKATFGNAGGVDIWVNGKLAPDAGANHTRKSGISLSPKNLLSDK